MTSRSTASHHTPGPWTTTPGTFFVCAVGGNDDDPGVWSEAYPPDGQPFPFGDKAADARLIASAPELLEAAQELSTAADSIWVAGISNEEMAILEKAWAKLDAAIAKATGEESDGSTPQTLSGQP